MATQVVVFSVLLFGTSGMVLDFGRFYNEHSQMQSFTDQAALAAANQLDGKTDAISRAVNHVFGGGGVPAISKTAVFSDGDGGSFGISHLFFLSDLTADDGPQYDLTADLAGPNLLYVAYADGGSAGQDIAIASTQARYVVAVADERSIRNSLMRLVNATDSDSVEESNAVRTIAAAKRRTLTCGSLSNLVMCNPWENDTGQSLASVMEDSSNVGIQFEMVADGFMDPTTGALSAPNSLARRMELEGPSAVAQICRDTSLRPGGSLTGAAGDVAEAICMLASATQPEFCVYDGEVSFQAAGPEEITTALSTAFDMWDYPISEVLDWDRDSISDDDNGDGFGDHSQEVDPATGFSIFNPGSAHALRGFSDLFQPDVNILKGRIYDATTADANEDLGIPRSSRLNYLRHSQYDNLNLNLNQCLRDGDTDRCVTDSDGAPIPYVSQPTTFTNVTEYYISNYRNLFRRNFQPPPQDLTSFYLTYQTEKGIPGRDGWLNAASDFTTLTGVSVSAGDSNAWTGEDASLDTVVTGVSPTVAQNQQRPVYDYANGAYVDVDADGDVAPGTFDPDDLEFSHPNYTYRDVFDTANERRVFDITFVNCGTTYVDQDDGETKAEVAGFAKMFLLQPPVAECGGGLGETCINSNIQTSTIYGEFISASENMDDQSYAVLVR